MRRYQRLLLLAIALFAIFIKSTDCVVLAEITYLGSDFIAADAVDQSGLDEPLEDGTPANRLGSFGSGIAYTGKDNLYVAVPDRGPNATAYKPAIDNTTSYKTRVQYFEIIVDPKARTVTAKNTRTTLLKNESNQHLIGLSTAVDTADPSKSLRFDPEAICISPTRSSFFISDEHGPSVSEFSNSGVRIGTFQLPAGFDVAKSAATAEAELADNSSGRQANRGLEGLAISPDGKKLWAILQNPLLQDHALSKKGNRIGTNIRIVEFDTQKRQPTRQLLYQLGDGSDDAGKKLGVNELLAVNDHQLLILERDPEGGKLARTKLINFIDLSRASDISRLATLPKHEIPPGIKPVQKRRFVDLLNPAYQLADKRVPEKIEGMTFGPDLPDGRHLLLVVSDDDFLPDQATQIIAFAIDRADLPGYIPQQFTAAVSR